MKTRFISLQSGLTLALFLGLTVGAAEQQPGGGGSTVLDLGAADDGDYVIGPTYTSAPEMAARDGVPKGAIHHFTMSSADSTVYPGLNGPYTRDVYVYIPRQYVPGTPAPFLVVQDGRSYTNRLPVALDNLIHDRRVPVMIGVMVHHGGGDGRGSERGIEYDTLSERYTTFIETEVLPRISKEYRITFTSNPEGRATMGCSSGAAAAFTMAWHRPDLYRRVLSYSGTFVNQQSPENPESPHGAWEYHENFIPKADRKPIRVWLHVSENDNGRERPEESYRNWVLANQRMAAALKARSYQYQYVYSLDSRHCDRNVVAQTLPGALVWLWRGYPVD